MTKSVKIRNSKVRRRGHLYLSKGVETTFSESCKRTSDIGVRVASSPRPIFANFTKRMTERNAKIGPGIHCRGIGAHALVVIQNLYNRQDIMNP